jgi:hypothetical protein
MSDKSLLTRLGETIDQYRRDRHATQTIATTTKTYTHITYWRWWLPTPGNVLFTVFVIGSLLWAQTVDAISLGAPLSATTATAGIPYQGRLANSSGQPLTQTVNMIFRLYASASGGTPLWEEQWTGSNSVQVSDGLFNVMLGSLTPIQQSTVTGIANLFLGITVGTDSEMSPRVQLGSVPFATQALTVPDGSIVTAKLADGSVTSAKLEAGLLSDQFVNQANIITNVQFGQGDTEKSVSATSYVDLVSIPLQLQGSSILKITYQGLVWKTEGKGRTALGIRIDGDANTAPNGASWVQVGAPVTTDWISGSFQLAHTWFSPALSGAHTVTLVLASWDNGRSHARSYSMSVETFKSP